MLKTLTAEQVAQQQWAREMMKAVRLLLADVNCFERGVTRDEFLSVIASGEYATRLLREAERWRPARPSGRT